MKIQMISRTRMNRRHGTRIVNILYVCNDGFEFGLHESFNATGVDCTISL